MTEQTFSNTESILDFLKATQNLPLINVLGLIVHDSSVCPTQAAFSLTDITTVRRTKLLGTKMIEIMINQFRVLLNFFYSFAVATVGKSL